ncbi:MAG: formylglycine-generating enzyme family protein, partial [Thermoguttaceae bacterium]
VDVPPTPQLDIEIAAADTSKPTAAEKATEQAAVAATDLLIHRLRGDLPKGWTLEHTTGQVAPRFWKVGHGTHITIAGTQPPTGTEPPTKSSGSGPVTHHIYLMDPGYEGAPKPADTVAQKGPAVEWTTWRSGLVVVDDELPTLLKSLVAKALAASTQETEPKVADPKPVTNSIGMKFVPIPPGTFMMGTPANEKDREKNESQHKVTISKGFLMAVTPVTQAQWKALTRDNPSHFIGDDLPVESVSWDGAVAFCEKLSQKEGKTYRLPIEAEWEYACRAGTATAYYTGDGEDDLAKAGWYDKNSDGKTHPVGQKKPNAWGLFDMHGNVTQRCSDWGGPQNGEGRALRGGSWKDVARYCRSGFRSWIDPATRYNDVGLRLVLDLPVTAPTTQPATVEAPADRAATTKEATDAPADRKAAIDALTKSLNASLPKDWNFRQTFGDIGPGGWDKSGAGVRIHMQPAVAPPRTKGPYLTVYLMGPGYTGQPTEYPPGTLEPATLASREFGTWQGGRVIVAGFTNESWPKWEDDLIRALRASDANATFDSRRAPATTKAAAAEGPADRPVAIDALITFLKGSLPKNSTLRHTAGGIEPQGWDKPGSGVQIHMEPAVVTPRTQGLGLTVYLMGPGYTGRQHDLADDKNANVTLKPALSFGNWHGGPVLVTGLGNGYFASLNAALAATETPAAHTPGNAHLFVEALRPHLPGGWQITHTTGQVEPFKWSPGEGDLIRLSEPGHDPTESKYIWLMAKHYEGQFTGVEGEKSQYATSAGTWQGRRVLTWGNAWQNADKTLNSILLEGSPAALPASQPATAPTTRAGLQGLGEPFRGVAAQLVFEKPRLTLDEPLRAKLELVRVAEGASVPAKLAEQGPPASAEAVPVLLVELKRVLPKTWSITDVREGKVAPTHWDEGTGIEVRLHRNGYRGEDWKRGLGGIVVVWVMDKGYAVKEKLPGLAQIDGAHEIGTWRGRRVFVWGSGGDDWKTWAADVNRAFGFVPPREERAHAKQLAEVRKLAAGINPGTTRAEVERVFRRQDGGLQGPSLTRYYEAPEVLIKVPYDRTGEGLIP